MLGLNVPISTNGIRNVCIRAGKLEIADCTSDRIVHRNAARLCNIQQGMQYPKMAHNTLS